MAALFNALRIQPAMTIGRAGALIWIAACLVPALLIAAPAGQPQAGDPDLSASERSSFDSSPADPTTLVGKVMVGYQGWFNCEGDGSQLGWKHWARHGSRPAAGNVTVDLWPDMTELEADEKFETDFRQADGSPASVFSSANPKTVARHFTWMRDYGIDGAFVQRFANQLTDPRRRQNVDRVLSNVRNGARQSSRVYAVMYDLSGMRAGRLSVVKQDWARLRSESKVTEDRAYLHVDRKPLVAIWGIGFSDRRQYTLDETLDLVKWFKANGCAVMLGVPSYWREGKRDALEDPKLLQTIELADVVSPWSVGRYRNPQEARRHADHVWRSDREWCQAKGIEFLPVVFPGFSWHQLKGEPLDQIPRKKGEFFWSQVEAAKRVRCNMIYVAMFDEVDEGTAIFKCTNEPPLGDGFEFLTYEGLPSDHYLKLAGKAGRLIEQANQKPGPVIERPDNQCRSEPND